MTLKEALIALAEGKKVRRHSWTKGSYLHLTPNGLFNEDGTSERFLMAGNDWELYEEPKKKIKVFEWLVEGFYSKPVIKGDILSEEEAKKKYPGAKLTPLRSFEVEES